MKKLLTILSLLVISLPAMSSETEKDPFDGLGDNRELYKQISQNKDKKIRIVQRRYNDRITNFEFSLGYGANLSGQNYLDSQMFQAGVDFHINPRWSVALRGKKFNNQLDREGEQVFDAADGALNTGTGGVNVSRFIPELNWKETQTELLGRWYPLYGKFSVLESSVIHFDLYSQLGVTSIAFREGSEIGFLGGVGVSAWLGPHWTGRLEFNIENFTQTLGNQTKTANPTEVNFTVGYIL